MARVRIRARVTRVRARFGFGARAGDGAGGLRARGGTHSAGHSDATPTLGKVRR